MGGKMTREMRERWYKTLWAEFLENLGPACHCCGESDPRFLSIGHLVPGERTKYKQQHGRDLHPQTVLVMLRRLGWPREAGIKPECFNCNMAANRYGVCPHQEDK